MKLSMDDERIARLIRLAVEEDVGSGDVTTEASVPADLGARAEVVAYESGVVAGLPLIEMILGEFTDKASVELKTVDGDCVAPGGVLAVVTGPARAILTSERTVLNFLRHLSGIATLTRRYVEAISGTDARIYDTRKTTPGWRVLEKYAVRIGGGENHRMGLYDSALIKDNHLALLAKGGKSLREAVDDVRAKDPGISVEIEAETEEDVRAAVSAGADVILLDNMPVDELSRAVKLVRELAGDERPLLEASGGITLETIRAVALTGVDRISVGAITHSAGSLDVAMDFESEGGKS